VETLPAKESRNWALATHLCGVFAHYILPLGGMLTPLVIWLVKKDDDAFVAHHALATLNFQITISLATLGGVFMALTVVLLPIAIPLLLIVALLSLVLGIQGAIAASEGRWFEYPSWIPAWVKPS
jgi:uncharacterized protein